MLKAGWLRKFTNTKGKVWKLQWTGPGAQRAALLKWLAVSMGLIDSDGAPVAFAILARGGRPAPGVWIEEAIPADVLRFFSECMDELDLSTGDEDELLILFHVCVGWAPDAETSIEFD